MYEFINWCTIEYHQKTRNFAVKGHTAVIFIQLTVAFVKG